MKQTLFREFFRGKKVAILGFGREGRSSYAALRRFMPTAPLTVCDRDSSLSEIPEVSTDTCTRWFFGEGYLEGLSGADLVLKSPGIPFKEMQAFASPERITSQTGLFLQLFGKQVAGITGTKGKSTVASLLHHIFKTAGKPSVLLGNIGVPPFDLLPQIADDTRIVFEMSSHQLQELNVSPHIAVLLNIFEEHLDHYHSYREYQEAKMNIGRWQDPEDFFLFPAGSRLIRELTEQKGFRGKKILLGKAEGNDAVYYQNTDLIVKLFGKPNQIKEIKKNRLLRGEHNLLNIAAAAAVAVLSGVEAGAVERAVAGFSGLPHRLEFAGNVRGITFYNDSISTIPEATIEAIKTFPETKTLILGGFDRGVNYKELMTFLKTTRITTIIFMGEAGKRMASLAAAGQGPSEEEFLHASGLEEAFALAVKTTPEDGIVLLSPAAASYDAFRNFEERGRCFKSLVKAWGARK